MKDPNFIEIGRPEIISRRTSRPVNKGTGGVLADYVPFYFNPRTPMLLNIKSGWQGLQQRPMNDIVILVASFRKLSASGSQCVFTDRNATLEIAVFETELDKLSELPWDLWRDNDFRKDDANPQKIERYMAEALVHESLAAKELDAIICHSETRTAEVLQMVSSAGLQIPVYCRPGWYC